MLEALFEMAVRLKSKLEGLEKLGEVGGFQETLNRAREGWRVYEPKPERAKVLGVDSGWNYRLYPGFYVYAIKAAAVDESMNLYHPVAEMDMFSEDPYQAGLTPDNFLKYQAEMREHDIAYKVLNEADLILVDGSLIARLMDVSKRSSTSLQTEYTAYVRPLIGNNKLAFVSKYSQDKSLFYGVLGDVYYINHATTEIGYTIPHVVERNNIKFSVFYVRLSEDSNTLHVEVPAIVDEDYVRGFINMLQETSIKGYPYVLRVAHKTTSVTDHLMDSLCKTAGLTGWIEAREVLEA